MDKHFTVIIAQSDSANQAKLEYLAHIRTLQIHNNGHEKHSNIVLKLLKLHLFFVCTVDFLSTIYLQVV